MSLDLCRSQVCSHATVCCKKLILLTSGLKVRKRFGEPNIRCELSPPAGLQKLMWNMRDWCKLQIQARGLLGEPFELVLPEFVFVIGSAPVGVLLKFPSMLP
jgi:hypothetical protein